MAMSLNAGLISAVQFSDGPIQSVLFVDGALARSESLWRGLSGAAVYQLDGSRDGVSQISEVLAGYRDLLNVQILSHGDVGGIQLGDGWLSGANLAQYSGQVSRWGESLSADGDLLLYGCDVAAGDVGQGFVNALAGLTQADVAASTNVTGIGGDWALEYGTGNIETVGLTGEGYAGNLAATLVKDIAPGTFSGAVSDLTNVNGTIFFTADDGVSGQELWKSDGTAAGTVLVKDINPGTGNSFPGFLTNVNGTLYFAATTTTDGRELWKSDGTAAGTVRVKDINAGSSSSNPSNLTNVNGTLFFAADNGVNGNELWSSNGTAVGTLFVRDIQPGILPFISSDPAELTNVNGVLLFTAFTRFGGGRELWKSDGTNLGTELVKDINPVVDFGFYYGSDPAELTNVNGTIFFSAYDDTIIGSGPINRELWKSDGTTAGTVLVKDINTTSFNASSTPKDLTNVNGTIFFSADNGLNGRNLWKSDGTTAGTVLVAAINPSNLTNVNGTLFFTGDDGNGQGNELWKSDGTLAGTVLVKDIYVPGSPTNTQLSANPTSLTNVNGILYFGATSRELSDLGFYYNLTTLWRSDGTANGTYALGSSTAIAPENLLNANGTLFFTALNSSTGRELYKYVPTKRDYDRDSRSDLIWRNATTGDTYVWDMFNQTIKSNSGFITNRPADWKIISTKDFNRDGDADLLWRNTATGDIYLWNMQNKTILNSTFVYNLDASWDLAASADFNNDGYTDLLWNNNTWGTTYLWNMNNNAIQTPHYITALGTAWKVAGTGDFNKDGNTDIIWRNSTTGDTYVWNMNNATFLNSSSYITTLPNHFQIVSTNDFNGDGKADLLWRNTITGDVYLWNMNNSAILNANYVTTLPGWTVADTADYNADNKTDILWRNLTFGDIVIWNMDNANYSNTNYVYRLDPSWQLAV
jgi:ELWxxDGT repeat protein